MHPQLHVTLQPLRFMEYLLEAVEQAALFCVEGVVLVNVPEPARFCLHKLIVHGERPSAFRVKSTKDLAQSAHLLSFLWQYQRHSVEIALDELLAKGRGWGSRFLRGVRALRIAYPELDAAAELELVASRS